MFIIKGISCCQYKSRGNIVMGTSCKNQRLLYIERDRLLTILYLYIMCSSDVCVFVLQAAADQERSRSDEETTKQMGTPVLYHNTVIQVYIVTLLLQNAFIQVYIVTLLLQNTGYTLPGNYWLVVTPTQPTAEGWLFKHCACQALTQHFPKKGGIHSYYRDVHQVGLMTESVLYSHCALIEHTFRHQTYTQSHYCYRTPSFRYIQSHYCYRTPSFR